MSAFGSIFKFATFGESHGKSVGAIVEGVPPNVPLKEDDIQVLLDRRRPGKSRLSTARNEKDQCRILSGVCPVRHVTLGTPIAVAVDNEDQRSFDYASVDIVPRPGHAEYTYQTKYGVRALSGGGRSSARETIGRCIAGAIAQKAINTQMGLPGVRVVSFVKSVGQCSMSLTAIENIISKGVLTTMDVSNRGRLFCKFDTESGALLEALSIQDDGRWIVKPKSIPSTSALSPTLFSVTCCKGDVQTTNSTEVVEGGLEVVDTQCPDISTAASMADLISRARMSKDTIGGVTCTVILGLPPGLGEPVFDKFEALLAHAMMSLPATKGFSIGEGFRASSDFTGSMHNDRFVGTTTSLLATETNHAGGTLGGITNGAPVYFDVAFKPVSSIGLPQRSADWNGVESDLEVKGRHDPCVLPRCPPLVDAMTLVVVADAIALQRAKGNQQWTPKTLTYE